MAISFTLNGTALTLNSEPTARLSDALRDEAHCLDVKVGCSAGDCGLCTVLLDGAAVCACLTPLVQVADKHVDTLTGLMESDPITQSLSSAFLSYGAAQCGVCIPGMLVAATPLLRQNVKPTEQEAQDALGGVLCRCTGYRKILSAVCRLQAKTTEPHSMVGASPVRIDGAAKVAGTERFGDDVAPDNALVLKVIRSPYHRARFSLGDIQAYVANNPGVCRVFTAADVPGVNAFGVIPPFFEQPVFAENEARFKGEAIAAVVGTAASIACQRSRQCDV